MSHPSIIARTLATLSLTATLVACEDTQTTTRPGPPARSEIVSTPPAPPAPKVPAPEATAAPPATKEEPHPEATKDQTTKDETMVANQDDGADQPVGALDGARKALADGQKERALKLAAIAVERSPKRSAAWNVLGRSQLQLGKRKDAITSFEKAVELNDRNSYARNNLGLALIYDGRYEEAVDVLEEAVQLEPVEGYMWNNLGMAYEHLDRLGDARDAYRKAVEMDSDRARGSLARLEGVKTLVRTAKVDISPKTGGGPDMGVDVEGGGSSDGEGSSAVH